MKCSSGLNPLHWYPRSPFLQAPATASTSPAGLHHGSNLGEHTIIFLWVNTNVILPSSIIIISLHFLILADELDSRLQWGSYCWSHGRVLLLEINEMMRSLLDVRARYCSGASHIDTGMKSRLWLISEGEGRAAFVFAISEPPPWFLSANLTTPSQFLLICTEQFDLSSYGWHFHNLSWTPQQHSWW